jgi:hypothetical protein
MNHGDMKEEHIAACPAVIVEKAQIARNSWRDYEMDEITSKYKDLWAPLKID